MSRLALHLPRLVGLMLAVLAAMGAYLMHHSQSAASQHASVSGPTAPGVASAPGSAVARKKHHVRAVRSHRVRQPADATVASTPSPAPSPAAPPDWAGDRNARRRVPPRRKRTPAPDNRRGPGNRHPPRGQVPPTPATPV